MNPCHYVLSWPINTTHTHPGSLDNNQLCGVDVYGRGTYTVEGISKLCEGLKGSAVISLSCAAARVLAFASAPVDAPPLLCWQLG